MKVSKTIVSMLIFGYAFLFIPIITLVFYSFSDSEIPTVWTKFSFRWFYEVFEDEDLIRAMITSFKIATISASGAVILGTFAAIITSSANNYYGKKVLSHLIVFPIVMPEIIVGFSLLMLFMSLEDILGFPKERGVLTVVIGHIMATMSYVHMTVRTRLLSFDKFFSEAALDLGAKPVNVFFSIKLPLISKSILAGWLLAFTMSLDDLVIASFLTGPGSTTLPILIFSNVRIGLSPTINALTTMILCFVILCLAVAYVFFCREKSKS